MLWFILAFFAAFFDSMKDVFSKTSLKHIDEYAVAWAFRFFAALFLIPAVFFVKIPEIGAAFWIALIAGGLLNVVTTILYMKAYKHSDLSITSPITTFSPLFLLVTSPFIINEFPKPLGLAGVLLIVMGSYALNIKERHGGYLAPIKALFRETGPRLMLLVAFIWSITSNIDKIGIKNSSPVFWAAAQSAFVAIVLLPVMMSRSGHHIAQIPKNLKPLASIGLFSALALIFQMSAFSIALVVYVSSIKRMSSIISVLAAHFVLKEAGAKERLSGAILMVLGAVLIAIS